MLFAIEKLKKNLLYHVLLTHNVKTCSYPEGHEVDHVIPLSKGGLHHEGNLQYLLKLDNRRKGSKLS